jgi:cobyrinic acid a,c-diamide synthase
LDDAFHCYYPDNWALLKKWGATLVPFSPIEDTHLPEDIQGIYIGGGYPEVYAQELSSNRNLVQEIQQFKGPIYGECGGLIYLSEQLQLTNGDSFPMLGLIEGRITMEEKLKGLGYVEVEILEEGPLGSPGERFRGHQFRYSTIEKTQGNHKKFKVRKKRGNMVSEEGHSKENTLGTYIHAHWASNEKIPLNFVKKAFAAGKEQKGV